MLDFLLELDTSLFLFINVSLANTVTDFIMPLITESDHWLPIYVILFAWLLIKGGKEGRIIFVLLIVGVILTDQISASLIKDWVGRLRPCKVFVNSFHTLICVKKKGGKDNALPPFLKSLF